MAAKVPDDRADATLIRAVAVALGDWGRATDRRPALKALREAVWFFWQSPRLPPPLVSSKYPHAIPWSEDAAVIGRDDDPHERTPRD